MTKKDNSIKLLNKWKEEFLELTENDLGYVTYKWFLNADDSLTLGYYGNPSSESLRRHLDVLCERYEKLSREYLTVSEWKKLDTDWGEDYVVYDSDLGWLDRTKEQSSNVDHPNHYNSGKIETIDYIEDQLTAEEFRGFCLGNALKYISRAKSKGNFTEDLEKAEWYLNRLTK